MPRMIEGKAVANMLESRGITDWPTADDLDQSQIIDLVFCKDCKWHNAPCVGYGLYGYCSDGEVK